MDQPKESGRGCLVSLFQCSLSRSSSSRAARILLPRRYSVVGAPPLPTLATWHATKSFLFNLFYTSLLLTRTPCVLKSFVFVSVAPTLRGTCFHLLASGGVTSLELVNNVGVFNPSSHRLTFTCREEVSGTTYEYRRCLRERHKTKREPLVHLARRSLLNQQTGYITLAR